MTDPNASELGQQEETQICGDAINPIKPLQVSVFSIPSGDSVPIEQTRHTDEHGMIRSDALVVKISGDSSTRPVLVPTTEKTINRCPCCDVETTETRWNKHCGIDCYYGTCGDYRFFTDGIISGRCSK